jgi:hypothetical protein
MRIFRIECRWQGSVATINSISTAITSLAPTYIKGFDSLRAIPAFAIIGFHLQLARLESQEKNS